MGRSAYALGEGNTDIVMYLQSENLIAWEGKKRGMKTKVILRAPVVALPQSDLRLHNRHESIRLADLGVSCESVAVF